MGESRRNLERVWWGVVAAVVLVLIAAFATYLVTAQLATETLSRGTPAGDALLT